MVVGNLGSNGAVSNLISISGSASSSSSSSAGACEINEKEQKASVIKGQNQRFENATKRVRTSANSSLLRVQSLARLSLNNCFFFLYVCLTSSAGVSSAGSSSTASSSHHTSVDIELPMISARFTPRTRKEDTSKHKQRSFFQGFGLSLAVCPLSSEK